MSREKKIEVLSAAICKRLPEEEDTTCSLCQDNVKCRVSEKTDEQLNYVLSSINESIFLQACPGSGKTEVIGIKAAYEMKQWTGTGGIAVLTFTNNAADVIGDRVSRFAGVDKLGFPHFVGTIDSWLHKYVGHPFGYMRTRYEGKNGDKSFKLIDEKANPNGRNTSFLHAYKLPTPYLHLSTNGRLIKSPIYANNISWDNDWEIRNPNSKRAESISFEEFCSSDAFDAYKAEPDGNGNTKDWLTIDKVREGFNESKKQFLFAGFATYKDVETICMRLLYKNIKLASLLANRFPIIIVDECQDLSSVQLLILEALKNEGAHIHFVGDTDQAIYEFKQVDPVVVKTFANDNAFSPLELTLNFRSCQPIIDLCQKLVPDNTPISSGVDQKVDSPCICITFPKDQMSDLPAWFANYVSSKSLDLQKSKIVSRGWSTVAKLRATGKGEFKDSQLWLATAIDLWAKGEKQSLSEAINLAGRFITKTYLDGCVRNKGSDYCPEDVESPLEWRLFVARVLDGCCQHERLCDLDETWGNWASIVRRDFYSIVDQAIPLLKSAKIDLIVRHINGFPFRALSKHGNDSVRATLPSIKPKQTDMIITTIHDVKGETLDAVMVVSSKDRTGTTDGFWQQWLEVKTSEAARLAFVASSRPKHLLVWAVPETDEKQQKQLEGIGFNVLGIND